jgi:hypothetical protein
VQVGLRLQRRERQVEHRQQHDREEAGRQQQLEVAELLPQLAAQQ